MVRAAHNMILINSALMCSTHGRHVDTRMANAMKTGRKIITKLCAGCVRVVRFVDSNATEKVFTFDFIFRLEFIPAARIAAHAIEQPILYSNIITCTSLKQPFPFLSFRFFSMSTLDGEGEARKNVIILFDDPLFFLRSSFDVCLLRVFFFSFFNQLCSFCVENAIKRTKTPDDGLLLSRASNLDMGLN